MLWVDRKIQEIRRRNFRNALELIKNYIFKL